MLFFMMAFRFSVLLQLSSCTYVYNYFSENARIKFIPIDADVSGVVLAYFCFIFQFPNLICYGLVDWLIRYPMTAVLTVVFTSCPTRGGQQRNQFKELLFFLIKGESIHCNLRYTAQIASYNYIKGGCL